jgi:hypothetical protein
VAEGMLVIGTENATGGMADGVKEAETRGTLTTRTEGALCRRDASTTGPAVRARIAAGQGRRPDAAAEAVVVSGRARPRRTSLVAGTRAARRPISAVVLRSAHRRHAAGRHHHAAGRHRHAAGRHRHAAGRHRHAAGRHRHAAGRHRRVTANGSATRGPLPGGHIRDLPQGRGVDALREGRAG